MGPHAEAVHVRTKWTDPRVRACVGTDLEYGAGRQDPIGATHGPPAHRVEELREGSLLDFALQLQRERRCRRRGHRDRDRRRHTADGNTARRWDPRLRCAGQSRGQLRVRIDGGRGAVGRRLHRRRAATDRGGRLARLARESPLSERLQSRQDRAKIRAGCPPDPKLCGVRDRLRTRARAWRCLS